MGSSRLAAASSWLLGLLLALAVPVVPLPYAAVSLAALGLRAGSLTGDRSGFYAVYVVVINLLALPFVAGAVWPGRLEVAVLPVLGLPWLAETLRSHGALRLSHRLFERHITVQFAALSAALAAAAVAGAVASQLVLVISAAVTFAGVLALATASYLRLRPQSLQIHCDSVRILAGETVETEALVAGAARTAGEIRIEPSMRWAQVNPEVLALSTVDARVRVIATPPLAGSGPLTASVTWIDPWGLTGTVSDRAVAHLRVIPRAAYAAWLARRYLETARSAGPSVVIIPEARSLGISRRGLDFFGARDYEPGDSLRDILWKQTARFRHFVVKDRRDETAQIAIIAARLAGKDPDEADRIAYHVLMTALTLAQEGVPVAFAAYTQDGVAAATAALLSRAVVQQALQLVEQIQVVPTPHRVLDPAHPLRLRRSVSRLQQSTAEPARRLAGILEFELRALQSRAQTHPATVALTRTIGRIRTPAAVVVISPNPDDAEVLNLTLDRVGAKGYQRIDLMAVSSS